MNEPEPIPQPPEDLAIEIAKHQAILLNALWEAASAGRQRRPPAPADDDGVIFLAE